MRNIDAFDRLLKSSFTVYLKRGDATIPLDCRELPFITALQLTSLLFQSQDAGVPEARAQLLMALQAFTTTPPNDGGQLSDEQTASLVAMVAPAAKLALVSAQPIMYRLLSDVVVDITEDQLKLLSTEDVVSIIDGVVEHTDLKLLADKLKQVFSKATAMIKVQPPAES
jgi:hypothetical protein